MKALNCGIHQDKLFNEVFDKLICNSDFDDECISCVKSCLSQYQCQYTRNVLTV